MFSDGTPHARWVSRTCLQWCDWVDVLRNTSCSLWRRNRDHHLTCLSVHVTDCFAKWNGLLKNTIDYLTAWARFISLQLGYKGHPVAHWYPPYLNAFTRIARHNVPVTLVSIIVYKQTYLMPIILWVWTPSLHRGCAKQCIRQAFMFFFKSLPSCGWSTKCLKSRFSNDSGEMSPWG